MYEWGILSYVHGVFTISSFTPLTHHSLQKRVCVPECVAETSDIVHNLLQSVRMWRIALYNQSVFDISSPVPCKHTRPSKSGWRGVYMKKMIFPRFHVLIAANLRLCATSYKLQATRYMLRAVCYMLHDACYMLHLAQLRAIGYKLHATGYRLPATG